MNEDVQIECCLVSNDSKIVNSTDLIQRFYVASTTFG